MATVSAMLSRKAHSELVLTCEKTGALTSFAAALRAFAGLLIWLVEASVGAAVRNAMSMTLEPA